jgi:uncharacterized protein (TIGR02145 family)
MKTKFFFGSFLIAGAALLFSCNSIEGFPTDLPKPDEEAYNPQPVLRGSYCVYSDTKQCFSGDFVAVLKDGNPTSPCPGKGELRNKCPYDASSSSAKASSSSGGSQAAQSSSSSVRPSSSSVPNCSNVAAKRMHQGVQKDQFCDMRDNKRYVYVKIGNQTWMAENLNYWMADVLGYNSTGSVCYSGTKPNCDKYGALYTFAAAKTACPTGWHLPSKAEWDELISVVGEFGGNDLKAKSDDWLEYGQNNKDLYGFSALPGGYHTTERGDQIKLKAYWWSNTQVNSLVTWATEVQDWNNVILINGDHEQTKMYSVRCIRDD